MNSKTAKKLRQIYRKSAFELVKKKVDGLPVYIRRRPFFVPKFLWRVYLLLVLRWGFVKTLDL